MLLQSRKVAPHNCFPKLLFKIITTENRVPKKFPKTPTVLKLLPKGAPQSCGSSKLPCKAAPPQSCSRAMPPKLCPKLFSKVVAPKLRFCNPVYQNVSPKPFCKVAPESWAPKLPSLPPKFVSCFLKLLPKAVVLQSNGLSMRLQCRKVAPHSCSPTSEKTPLQSGCPKAAMLQTYSPKLFSKAAPESCSPKLLPKAAVLQSCRAKLLLKAAP